MSTEEKELLEIIWKELGMIYTLLEDNFQAIIKLLEDIRSHSMK